MTITINGSNREVPSNITVKNYLIGQNYQLNRIAIELNHSILPKSKYDSTVLVDGDQMEIVTFSLSIAHIPFKMLYV